MTEAGVGFMPPLQRPIRIPESASLGHSEPPFALAGERGTWRLPLELARDVAPDMLLKLQTGGGRSNRPSFADDQVADPAAGGYITLRTAGGEALALSQDEPRGHYSVAVPQAGLKAGELLTLVLGDRSGGGGGLLMPNGRALDKFVVLYEASAPDDHPNQWNPQTSPQIVAACSLHILGNAVRQIRAYVPSHVKPGEPFSVLVRPEDEHSNLSHQLLTGAQVSLDGEALTARPEPVRNSTCLRLHVALPREGVHRLKVVAEPGAWEGLTNPVVCTAEEREHRPLWGMIHGHTEMSDGRESLDNYFHQLRYEAGLDFGATSDHDSRREVPDPFWEVTCRAAKTWNDPRGFVAFLGYEWARWHKNGDGDRNVYYLHDDRPMYRCEDGDYPRPADLFEALRDETAMIIPHHTAHGGNFCDWTSHEPERERLVEIHQALGCFECSEAEGNLLPCRSPIPAFEGGYVRNGLAAGWRVGFTSGGDDHNGHAGTEFPVRVGESLRMTGAMYVLAAERTRESIWHALWNRRVVATSGPRMLLSYTVNGHPIGSELNVASEPDMESARALRVECHGTAPLEWIEIIRNNEVAHTHEVAGQLDCELTWEDTALLSDLWLPPTAWCASPFCFYYVRVLQQDGQMAWASPVWVSP